MMGVKLASILTAILIILHGLTSVAAVFPEAVEAATSPRSNTTYYNPILPGFHPDPSCIFLREWDNTFFCASSSFNAFPGIPLHASKDLRNWKLIGHALNRNEQLPRLAETNRSTSGIWAATLRYHKGTFYVITTLVDDDRPPNDASRWDNIIFKSKDPYTLSAWSIATHFSFEGYDPDLFWDVGADGKEKTYVTGAHAWQVDPGIWQAEADLEKGTVGELKLVWKGTGGTAPEGPHIYKKDGWYYLLAAEGGTGLEHMVTISRSKNIIGPFEQNPANPVLTNTNTTSYFQTIGHSDLFQDRAGNWWAVALSTRGGPEYLHFPMVRETVLTPVTWKQGEWPVFSPIRGEMSGWDMGKEDRGIKGVGPFVDDADDIDFAKLTRLPEHFTHWRYPIPSSYTLSPPSHPGTLRLTPSVLNLTALTGNYAGPAGQTFVGRRQSHTLFTYTVDLEFSGTVAEEEVGVSAFLTQNHHIDVGVVMLTGADGALQPHLRYRAISYIPLPEPIVVPFPVEWKGYDTGKLALEIRAVNASHYAFSAGPTGARSLRRTIATVSNEGVSWGFTGVLLGVYSTTNGGAGSAPAYISKWKYVPEGQFRD